MTSTIVSQNLVKLATLPTLPLLIVPDVARETQREKQALRQIAKAVMSGKFVKGDSPSMERKALDKQLRLTEELLSEELPTESPEEKPEALDPYIILRRKHEEEFKASAIHPDLMENFKTHISSKEIMDLLANETLKRTNPGRVPMWFLETYDRIKSGWSVGTEGSDYVQCKPDAEYRRTVVDENGKESIVKYENPPKFPIDIFRHKFIPVWLAEQLGCDVKNQRFWEWVNTFTGSLWITEGAKKAASLLSKGKLTIGLAGINNLFIKDADGNPVLIPALREVIKNKTEIVLSLDAPDKLTQIQPLIFAYHKLKKEILKINPKCDIKMAVWDWHLGKGCDDVIAAGHWDKIKVVPFYEGLLHLNCNIPAVKRIVGKEYLSLEDVGHFAAKTLGIKAGKNSGKTHITAQYLKELIGEDEKILNIGHRIKLSRSQAKRFGLYYLKDVVDPGEKVLAQTQVSLCINSLTIKNGFNPANWQNATIILDEVVQLVKHLVASGTVRDILEILNNFKHILLGAKKIILLDADLDFATLRFFDELLGAEFNFLRTIKVYQFEKEVAKMPMIVRKCNNRNVGTLTFNEILKQLLNGKKVLVMTDSKSPTSALGVENLVNSLKKAYLSKTGKELRGLAISADNTKNQSNPASLINTNLDIVYDYDLVIYTSVLGTGVSFEKQHFDVVIGGFTGSLSIDEILQGMYRYRVGVQRIVFVPNKGTQFKRDGSEYSYRENKYITDKIKKEVLLGYSILGGTPDNDDDDKNLNSPCMNFHCTLRGIGRWESDNFLRLFIEKAGQDYDVTFDDLEIKVEKPEVVKETIKEAVEKLAEVRVNSGIIHNSEKYETMKAAETLSEKDFHDFDKTKLAKKYQLMENEEVLTKELITLDIDNKNYHSQISMHYNMDHTDYAEVNGEEIILRPDIDTKYSKEPKTKAEIMNRIGAKLLRTEDILHRNHPTVLDIIKLVEDMERQHPGLIKRHLGITFKSKDSMTFVTSLALKQGIASETVERKPLPNGERVSKKRFFIPDTMRYQLFEVWQENDEIRKLENQEYKLRQQIDKMTELMKERVKSEDVTAEEIENFDVVIPQLQKQHDDIQARRIVLTETRNEKRAERQSMREDQAAMAQGLSQADIDEINNFG